MANHDNTHPHHHHDHDHDHDHDHGHDHKAHAGRRHDHGQDHDHDHGGHHHVHTTNETRLKIALAITLVFMSVEVIGGLVAGSLALIADAVHMLTDGASLVLALFALRAGRRPADSVYSYGHHRYEVLAAFVNGLALLGLSAWIVVESVLRLWHPEPVLATTMFVIAALGFAANLVSFLVLRDGDESLNMRGAVIHVLGDLLGSAAAMVAAVAIYFTRWTPIDPILSAFVALLILRGGWRITRQSARILLEGTPSGLDPAEVTSHLLGAVPALRSIHHLHIWSLTDARPMMTLHAQLDEDADADATLRAVSKKLMERFGVVHVTVQIERTDCADSDSDQRCHDHAKPSLAA
jgi:cobalt-zinc-cadmium efflux system protein